MKTPRENLIGLLKKEGYDQVPYELFHIIDRLERLAQDCASRSLLWKG